MTSNHRENDIKNRIESKFSFMKDKILVKRSRRIFAEVDYSNFRDLFDNVVKENSFERICMITGFDEGDNFAFIYHLTDDKGIVFDIKTAVAKNNPVIKTVSDVFPGGVLYERELVDMFGVKVEGLPEGERYPLPDNWPAGQYPLRKDWNRDMLKDKEV